MLKGNQLNGIPQNSSKNLINNSTQSNGQSLSNRFGNSYVIECERKDCMIVKLHGIQMQHQLLLLQKDLDKYKALYMNERKKINDTYNEVEEIMEALQKKEKDIKIKEIKLLEFEQTLLKKNQKNDSLNETLKILKKNLIDKESQLAEKENQINLQANNQTQLIDDLNNLKDNLESSVKYLEQKESQLFNNLQMLNQQEQETLQRVEHINQFISNSNQHLSMMESIEQLFKQKNLNIENVKQSVIQKQEELQMYEQQLHLKSVCTSLNEATFRKKVAQTEKIIQKTPTQESNKKSAMISNTCNTFSNQNVYKIQQNKLISTISSRENSPISNRDSFKIIRRPYFQNQMPMQEINNFDIKFDTIIQN
ncbi:unnamed protein product [Paramecium sonneborni]|uniref:Uncharacterized protein n=1 Tax=Paramecium sonneborni TaxID=65129 RepID=A0A8S1NUF6_9CILI|nr:unnamed protein product [Paramecium sonneborni]